MGIALVVFDMAGTTVADAGQVPAAFTAALRRHGIDLAGDVLRGVRGASKRDAIARLVAMHAPAQSSDLAARTATIYADFCRELGQRFAADLQPVPGAAGVFQWLRSQAVKVALTTGFDRATTDLILRTLVWTNATVDAVVCGEDVPQGRPAPYLIFRAMEATGVASVHRVAVLGDTILDLQAGWNAGVSANIGVLSGAHSRDQLEQAPHTALISSVAALPDIWDAIERRAAAGQRAAANKGVPA
jgi:phosphonatase-like hydrolase